MSVVAIAYLAGWLATMPIAWRGPVGGVFTDLACAVIWASWPIIALAALVRTIADAAARNEIDK